MAQQGKATGDADNGRDSAHDFFFSLAYDVTAPAMSLAGAVAAPLSSGRPSPVRDSSNVHDFLRLRALAIVDP